MGTLLAQLTKGTVWFKPYMSTGEGLPVHNICSVSTWVLHLPLLHCLYFWKQPKYSLSCNSMLGANKTSCDRAVILVGEKTGWKDM